MDDLTYDQFVAFLRSALHYLYDPVHLRRSPLVDILALSSEFDQAAALQQTLTTAIRALKPAEDESPQSSAWRIYDTLNLQYVRQLAREAVATQLGISERQMRREQRSAIEALAQHLWRQAAPKPQAGNQPEIPADDDAERPLSRELGWLKTPEAEERIPFGAALDEVLTLAQPLAQQWKVSLQSDLQTELAALPANRLALRSILITLLTVAVPRAGHSPVVVTATLEDSAVRLHITCSDRTAMQLPFSAKEVDSLAAALELASFYGATLEYTQSEKIGFVVNLTLPAPVQVPVLVIDDNADWLELVQRYASGSRYQIIGAREPATARALAEKVQPSLILLDVMMQNVDGWQVLGELHQEPSTSHIPVVICTILPVEGMALSLGASAFLQKPVSQQQFLSILDQQSRLLD
ncbi:MAG: response regulator [Caldilinea sp.]